jgi:hypothetical protein
MRPRPERTWLLPFTNVAPSIIHPARNDVFFAYFVGDAGQRWT